MMRQGNSSLQNLFLQFLFVHVSFQPIGLIRRLPFGNGLAVDHFRQFLILCTCLTNHFSIRKQSRHFRHLRKNWKKMYKNFVKLCNLTRFFKKSQNSDFFKNLNFRAKNGEDRIQIFRKYLNAKKFVKFCIHTCGGWLKIIVSRPGFWDIWSNQIWYLSAWISLWVLILLRISTRINERCIKSGFFCNKASCNVCTSSSASFCCCCCPRPLLLMITSSFFLDVVLAGAVLGLMTLATSTASDK